MTLWKTKRTKPSSLQASLEANRGLLKGGHKDSMWNQWDMNTNTIAYKLQNSFWCAVTAEFQSNKQIIHLRKSSQKGHCKILAHVSWSGLRLSAVAAAQGISSENGLSHFPQFLHSLWHYGIKGDLHGLITMPSMQISSRKKKEKKREGKALENKSKTLPAKWVFLELS